MLANARIAVDVKQRNSEVDIEKGPFLEENMFVTVIKSRYKRTTTTHLHSIAGRSIPGVGVGICVPTGVGQLPDQVMVGAGLSMITAIVGGFVVLREVRFD